MSSVNFDYHQAKLLEKKVLHPYALQGLNGSSFVAATNKILAGEFGIISFRRNAKKDFSS